MLMKHLKTQHLKAIWEPLIKWMMSVQMSLQNQGINSLFSPRTVSTRRKLLLAIAVFAVKAESAVVAPEVWQSPAAPPAADGRGPRALLGALGTDLLLG